MSMLTISELKRHPLAILTYVIYLGLWIFLIAAFIRISAVQAASGEMRCMTGPMVTYFALLWISVFYLISTLFFAIFDSDRRFFIKISIAILVPLALAFLWRFTW
ncbi:hypothetical protein [Dyadobacter sp. CY312]|uniref:hypothetical protein n=1 Tax=Dyadobacter sp. CY312 TaxID=2907303 RepID=UPI001F3F53B6|nr:hypothetical protein [Dyadobacter sp. CY312]MCE7039795.1 hypothetical protein [Dyadobacter sp. CY312]